MNNSENNQTGATFALDENDPRRVENRGGMEEAYPATPDVPTLAEALASEHGEGDGPSGELVDVGPVEGSQSGATEPRVEMTDIGLMDTNTTDVSQLAEPTDSDA